MTEEEKQSIISEILSAIRTNSLTIDDLTQLDTMPSDAYIEISGGRRISCETLKQAVASLFDDDIHKLYIGISNIDKSLNDEAQRAEEAETELEKRLMGTSTNSNSNTDPYQYFGNLDCDELNNKLDTLTYNTKLVGKGYGYFRAKVNYRDVEIKNILLSSSLNIIVQVVKGMFVVADNKLVLSDNTFSILMRKCVSGTWGNWSVVINNNSISQLHNEIDNLKSVSTSNANEIDNLKSQQTTICDNIDSLDEQIKTLSSGYIYRGYVNSKTTLPVIPKSFYLANESGKFKDANGEILNVQGNGVNLLLYNGDQWRIYELWKAVDNLSSSNPNQFLSANQGRILKQMIDQLVAQGSGGGGTGNITVDSELSETSLNPVQNAVITAALKELSNEITASYDDDNYILTLNI